MTRIQGASFAALISLASALGHADTLLVNTTVDEDNVPGGKCSLREAVSYIHQKNIIRADLPILEASVNYKNALITNRDSDIKIFKTRLEGATGAEKDFLEAEIARVEGEISALKAELVVLNEIIKSIDARIVGLRIFGCSPMSGSVTDNDVISLESDKPDSETPIGPYLLSRGPLLIKDALTIQRDNSTNGSSTSEDNALPEIKVVGSSRALVLDDGVADQKQRIIINLKELIITGCNSNGTTDCATHGGIIHSREVIDMDNVTLRSGRASVQGGALYLENYAVARLQNSTLEANQAPEGAALYSLQPGVRLIQSLVVGNKSLLPGEAAVKIVNTDFPDNMGVSDGPLIQSSTFSGNDGLALRVSPSVRLRNLTIVMNQGGIDFNNANVQVTNSIIAGNNGADCLNAGALTKFRFNLFSAGCPLGGGAERNRQLTAAEKLMADRTPSGGCALPPADGLLCPLEQGSAKTRYHKPRLLSGYATLDESPIVNKGASPLETGTDNVWACHNVDQRSVSVELCDIGAVELVTVNQEKQGKDIKSGAVTRFSMLEKIGDAELMPAASCPPASGNPNYHPEVDGCPTIILQPTKGTIQFDNSTREIVYSSNGNYHGRDNFNYSVITTLTRFSNASNSQTLTMNTTVVAEPDNVFSSKTFAGGAIHAPFAFALAMLAFWRRRVKRG